MVAKAKDYVAMPDHDVSFFKNNGIGFEGDITKVEKLEKWEELKPFMATAHLPYSSPKWLNIASYDDQEREADIEFLKGTIATAASYGVRQCVLHPCGFESRNEELVGCYERMIDAMKQLAKFASKYKLIICVENMVLRNPKQRYLYGSFAAQWYQIYEDVDESNLMLTLDTSHAASSILGYKTLEDRQKHLFDFLAHPERIVHLHWSDARIATQEALFQDMHLIPGEGDLPLEFHRQVKKLDAVRVFEQNKCTDEQVLQAINFVENL